MPQLLSKAWPKSVEILPFVMCIGLVCAQCANKLSMNPNSNNSLRIELSSTSKPPGNPADVNFLIINESTDSEEVYAKIYDGMDFHYAQVQHDRFVVPACSWKEIPVTVIPTDAFMERVANNLTFEVNGNVTGIHKKTIPYYPYRVSRENSAGYCYNQSVSGNCSSSHASLENDADCSIQRWEAVATMLGSFEIRSIPAGLFVPNSKVLAAMPGSVKPYRRLARIRVSIATNCCNTFVQIISGDPLTNPISSTCLIAYESLPSNAAED